MNLKQIKSLADSDRYDEALAECESLLRSHPEDTADILRVRADVFALQGDFARALCDREMVLTLEPGTLKDYYRAADHALYAGELKKAIHGFNEVLRLGRERNEAWFDTAAYLFLAYAYMQLECYEDAIRNANSAATLDADCAMPLPEVGMCSVEQLRKEIMRRKGVVH